MRIEIKDIKTLKIWSIVSSQNSPLFCTKQAESKLPQTVYVPRVFCLAGLQKQSLQFYARSAFQTFSFCTETVYSSPHRDLSS